MRISIFGYGVTTTPLVAFLNKQGHTLHIYDDKFDAIKTDEFGNTLLPPSHFDATQSDMEILSPGIPPSHPLVLNAHHLMSEYDYFENLLRQDSQNNASNEGAQMPFMIWISGTNGKTTTTEMTTLLLASFGAQSGGNIGTPLVQLYAQKPKVWVLETSSFMLHYTHNATPRIYALLPVKEDHISWHGSFEAYIEDKLSPLSRMDSASVAFIPAHLRNHRLTKGFQGKLICYERSADLSQQCSIDMDKIVFKEPFLLDALLALGIAKYAFNADNIDVLNHFVIGKHRIEEFYDKHHRLWVDDSKGTNVDASIQAIRRYEKKHIMLILGGDDKGANLTPLFECMQGKDIEIFSIGANESRLIELAKNYQIPLFPCQDIYRAMEHIHKRRDKEAKDVVLLSPAAASLDQFSSYKERGEIFTRLALAE